MSEIVKTEAIVLKTLKYRESSKIVTYFTKDHGKLSAIIKGARTSKNMYGTALEPMSYVALILYEKKGREIQTVTQCEVIHPYRHLFDDLEKMVIGMAIIELVRNIAHEQEKNVPLFQLLVKTLTALNSATENAENLFYAFEIHLSDILGFRLSFDKCVICGDLLENPANNARRIEFQLEKGAPVCEKCKSIRGQKVSVPIQVLMILSQLAVQKDVEKVSQIKIEKNIGLEIESLLFAFLRFHVSGAKALKSRRVFRNIYSMIK